MDSNIGSAIVGMNIFPLFMQAGIAVRCIIILLFLSSIWTWSIIIHKIFSFAIMRREFKNFEKLFWSGQSLEELYRLLLEHKNSGLSVIFISAMREWRKSFEKGACSPVGIQDRIDRMMDIVIAREFQRMTERLGGLATLGSVSPLAGLLGTVIGIMNAFQNLAVSKSTSLAIVAPGITEALLTTAIGICVAIPASVAYNKFMEDSKKFLVRMEGFADEFSAILSRQVEGKMN
ncbi:protein TolQ [Candidatus Liberibacter sp.]|uniref:protein TolQ n=1 Tax=Candidatus Liberibacter sp. TaxID=34022 RepID=UPI0015F60518|nr:protein TolQ [Candidatus Liberibacter sp.]MBA5723556.1 protein TolQ [Candidatus Liberibacter sp.]